MKKLILLIIMIPCLAMTLLSNEVKIEKINHNGIDGYFITHAYYQEILKLNVDYEYLRKQYDLLNDNYALMEKINLQYKNQLKFQPLKDKVMAGSIAGNVAGVVLMVATGFLIYALK